MLDWLNKYNPFNSYKVLMWREWLKGCAERKFMPPVTIYVDPSGQCGWNCLWCNSADYNENKNMIPGYHLLDIADFAALWGVKSIHVFGGGEPLMNPAIIPFLNRIYRNSMEAGLITNGALLNDKTIDTILKTCRWIGISLDAGSKETFMKVKGVSNENLFDIVVNNLRKLCEMKKRENSECSICAKYLLHPENVFDMLAAVKLAKEIGVDDFQVRPAGWENVKNKNIKEFDFSSVLDVINTQMIEARKLETETFHVYGVWHKFAPDMNLTRGYSKCWASPLVLLFGADGKCYPCGDRRGQEEFVLCSHYPDIREVQKVWGTEKHKRLLDSIKLDECPRCVLGPYHEIVEKVFIKDQMCRNFP